MKKHSWAKYIVKVKYSPWGNILYASSIVTANAMALFFNGVIEQCQQNTTFLKISRTQKRSVPDVDSYSQSSCEGWCKVGGERN